MHQSIPLTPIDRPSPSGVLDHPHGDRYTKQRIALEGSRVAESWPRRRGGNRLDAYLPVRPAPQWSFRCQDGLKEEEEEGERVYVSVYRCVCVWR
jgi:hypothetical protein